ncbi:MAG: glucosamine-6-phosphate deaminase [Nanoarchaeota archaeon]|nr:glucosamine-6-phosphate deaminase [Nanoarchaeota archaeon]
MPPKVLVFASTYELHEYAVSILKNQLKKKPSSRIGLSTGKTMIPFYNHLACAKLNFSKATTFNQDEYLKPDSKTRSFKKYMEKYFLNKTNISPKNFHIPESNPANSKKSAQEYEKAITKSKVDLQILGLGRNGHIGFNEPGTPFISKTHVINLTPSTRKANNTKTRQALTIGISTTLHAKKIILIATGEHKAKAIKTLLQKPISTKCPASALRKHKDVTILLDKAAAKEL